jgi:hypothetical protein
MKDLSKLVLLSVMVTPLACTDTPGGSGEEDSADPSGDPGECVVNEEVTGEITEDTTWSCDKILGDLVTVSNNAVLTVDPGVVVRGKTGSALIVAQGSRLEAEGTAEAPIVFTSAEEAGARARGDWGGIVLLGNAATNLEGGTGLAEGLEKNSAFGGGADPDLGYSCGTLKYLRVEFAGFELTTDNELNGIGLYACGSGTVVDYVQVHMGDDDGLEAFGGNWTGTHIVVSGAADDALDLDAGFTGKLQWVLVQQDPVVGNYGFEWSNQSVKFDSEPRTSPTIANATLIGTGAANDTKSGGIKLKEGVAAAIHNSIVTNFYLAQVELTEQETELVADAGDISLTNVLFFNNSLKDDGATPYIGGDMSDFDIPALVENPDNRNILDTDPQLGSIAWGSLDAAPRAGSPVLGAGQAVSGFEATDYLGAIKDADSDWTRGWTNWSPN